jgi:hypothetical protein
MQRSLSRFVLPLAIAVVAIYFGDGCILDHPGCVTTQDVIRTDHFAISLGDLTSPTAGRNLSSTTHEDRITATVEPLQGTSQQMEIRLVAGPNVTWWKAVEIQQGVFIPPPRGCFVDRPGRRLGIAETEGARTTQTTTLRNDQAATSTLVFWKAKALGVHTAMYQLKGHLGALQGQRLTINWEVD